MTCRTLERGFHVDACHNGDYRVILPNSCKNRSCPQCGATETRLWLERCRLQALGCPSFHGVITVSHDLHPIWEANRRLFTGLMMKTAWHSLREMLGDFRWLGRLPGVIMVFQSWDDHFLPHSYLHLVITAGGLNKDDRWVTANEKFLLPVPAFAAKFKGKFLAYLKDAFNPLTKTEFAKQADQVLIPPSGKTVRQCLNLLNRLDRMGEKGCQLSMISCSIQFFSNYLAKNRFVDRFSTLRKIFPEGFINHCLVPISSFFRSCTEIINDIRVKVHCNSGFSFCRNNLTSFGLCKIIFLFHIVSFGVAFRAEIKRMLSGRYV